MIEQGWDKMVSQGKNAVMTQGANALKGVIQGAPTPQMATQQQKTPTAQQNFLYNTDPAMRMGIPSAQYVKPQPMTMNAMAKFRPVTLGAFN